MPGMTWKARTWSAVPVSYTALLIAQRDVEHTRFPAVQRPVCRGRVLERELGRGQRAQRELTEQSHGAPAAAADVPAAGEGGGDGGHLTAADRQPTPVERAAEGQLDGLAAVPGPHQGGALVRQQVQRTGERGGGARELEEERHTVGRQARRQLLGLDGGDAQRDRELSAVPRGVGGDHGGA